MVKATEATPEQIQEAVLRLIKNMQKDLQWQVEAGVKDIKTKYSRIGHFVVVMVPDKEKRFMSGDEHTIIISKQPVKSVELTFHDSPEVAEVEKKRKVARRKELREQKNKEKVVAT